MARRKPPDVYAIEKTILRIVGDGNSVALDDGVIGPITLPESVKASGDLILAGAAPFAAGSKTEIPGEQAFSRIAAGAKRSFRELLADSKEARRQSRVFFLLMCIFSGTGICLILFALGLLLFGRLHAGIIGTVASTVSQAVTMVLFKKDRELRRTIDSYNAHIASYHKALAMIDLAETISDSRVRDKSKQEIIRSLLTVRSPDGAELPQADGL